MNKEEKAWIEAVLSDKIKNHTESSPQTIALFDRVEDKLDGLKELFTERFKQNEKDHNALKEAMNKKASKWTEKAIMTLMTGSAIWVLNQLLNLIPTVQALIN